MSIGTDAIGASGQAMRESSGPGRGFGSDLPIPRGDYLVAGLGRAGFAAATALAGHARVERVVAWDRLTEHPVRVAARRLRRLGVEVVLGGDGRAALDAAGQDATVIKSPGLDPGEPIFADAREHGLVVFDELELGWRLSGSRIVGVTGTNGKSTVAHLVAIVLGAGGHSVQLAGNTEFGPPLSAADARDWIVCEVSSFQLEATPSFLPAVGVFTNLTLDHLNRHTDMTRYGEVKRGMFVREDRAVGAAVVNVDDPFGRALAEELAGLRARVVGYGFGREADVRVLGAEWDLRGARVSLRAPDGDVSCVTRLPGLHNASNVAAAFAVGHLFGLSAASIAGALDGVAGPPGRFELVAGPGQPFDVVVDFAHNPDGIRRLLQSVRAVVDRREGACLRVVYGPLGAHEPRKAHESGMVARELSDQLILTTGIVTYDARLVGLRDLRRAATVAGSGPEVVLDRREAIVRAIASARAGDVVALLGLGARERLVLDTAGTAYPFDDRRAAREALDRVTSAAVA
jgi:UDP-N-acetylmuramoyl-L-alanyl-D-glutamate--2,6-diaminopimelate ligase